MVGRMSRLEWGSFRAADGGCRMSGSCSRPDTEGPKILPAPSIRSTSKPTGIIVYPHPPAPFLFFDGRFKQTNSRSNDGRSGRYWPGGHRWRWSDERIHSLARPVVIGHPEILRAPGYSTSISTYSKYSRRNQMVGQRLGPRKFLASVRVATKRLTCRTAAWMPVPASRI